MVSEIKKPAAFEAKGLRVEKNLSNPNNWRQFVQIG
jgi:hypothetical protein